MGRAERLDDEDMDLFRGIGPGAMLDAPGDEDDLAFPDGDDPILEAHFHVPLDDIKKLVGLLMDVKDELPLEFRKIHLQIRPFGDDMGMPLLGEKGELLFQVDGFHQSSLPPAAYADTILNEFQPGKNTFFSTSGKI